MRILRAETAGKIVIFERLSVVMGILFRHLPKRKLLASSGFEALTMLPLAASVRLFFPRPEWQVAREDSLRCVAVSNRFLRRSIVLEVFRR